ncbi:MAG: MMPL family transporter [Candidatus Heimdallarchaeaceae archaeon]
MKFVQLYHKFLQKYKHVVLILWLVILAFGVWLGPRFLSNTKLVFDSPAGSPSAIAEEIFISEFPDRESESNIIILIKNKEQQSVINQEVNETVKNIISSLENFEYNEIIESTQDYFTLVNLGFTDLANELVSKDGYSLITVIEYLNASKNQIQALQNFLENEIEKLDIDKEKYYIGLTGSDILILDIENGTKHDLARMDAVVLPIALIVLALVLRSFRLMIIPIFTMILSTFTSFLIMLPISNSINVISFAPSVIMSCVIAMSIDYSLFLLTRYREEILKGKNVSTAVALMSEHAGHTIIVSGLTLAICFMGLIFFPMDLLQSIGIGASIAVLITIIVNLTITPSLLLIFQKFFSDFFLARKIAERRKKEKDISVKDKESIELENQLKSIWYRISKFSTKYSVIIILVVLIAAIPISIQVVKLKHTVDTNQVFPRNMPSVQTYNMLIEEFDPGVIFPYYIIIQGPEDNAVFNQTFFNVAQQLIESINTSLNIPYENILSIFTQPNGLPIPYIYALQFLDSNSSLYYSNEAQLYRIAFQRYVNPSNSSAVIQINTPFDPFASEDFVKQVRIFLDEFSANLTSSDYKFYLAGGICTIVDSIDKVYELFPIMIIVTIIIVYVLIALMFGSVFVPLRLLFTIALTLSWIYGFAVLIFELNIVDWLFEPLKTVDAMYWITPIMAFSILVGLGLDYDIFLLSRISEYRKKGYTETASIHKGVYRTGPIISAAGIIMAIAFSGLMLSKEMVLNQFGFMLCFAVIVDTFVIRTILVPAIMSLAQKWNWWPSKLPKEEKDELFFGDEF